MGMAPAAINTHENYSSLENNDNLSSIDHGIITNGAFNQSKSLVERVMKDKIARIDVDTCQPGEEDAFYVADLGEVYRQHLRWKMSLGRVKPFYGKLAESYLFWGVAKLLSAVKCNPDKEILRLLARLGTGFDCASRAEIELVLSLGVEPGRIIYAQPCKTKSYLRYARQEGVKQMTFDNADELYKIKGCFPDAELVLRISTDDSASLCRLSAKYGAGLEDTGMLLGLAKQLELNVMGVSFHVGSGASDPGAFAKSVRDARKVFDQGESLGFDFTLLDIGGGFVDESFEIFAASITNALAEHFPPSIRVISEPGRYYAANAFTLAVNVIARREVENKETGDKSYMLYLNDGAYGNFSNIIFDHQHPEAQILHTNSTTKKVIQYSIWGPTCDGIDVISQSCVLPAVLDTGDWLFFENMGAYTKCSATKFNGFTDNHEVVYVSSEAGATALMSY